MIKKLFILQFFFLFQIQGKSQNLYTPKNHRLEAAQNKGLYDVDSSYHTSINLNSPILNHRLRKANENQLASNSFGFKSWFGKKGFDENLAHIKGENYELALNPIVNFQIGQEASVDELKYFNARGISLEGRLGENFTFSTSFIENQAVFASYISDFVNQWEVSPQLGLTRKFGDNGYDFNMANGEINYKPNDIFTFTAGQGRNFFGEGYRSMLLSDATFNYPFFRIQTTFGKVKYVNLWAQLNDVRKEVAPNYIFQKKSLASHYLSIDVTKRLNISFFEAIILSDTAQQRQMDVSFFNPIIFYRPIEFAIGSNAGNALLGIASSYKITKGTQVYSQFILDEFTGSEFFAGTGYWGNKYGFQLGVKSFDVFGIPGLFARAEYNLATPLTYSHLVPLGNYAHYSQSLAHPWGANFREYLIHLQYNYKRWELEMRFHFGQMGLDTAGSNWGSNVYLSYKERERDYGNEIGQGVPANLSFIALRASWLVNPASNLKVEIGARIRNLDSDITNTSPISTGSSTYIYFGLRTELFNQYYDF